MFIPPQPNLPLVDGEFRAPERVQFNYPMQFKEQGVGGDAYFQAGDNSQTQFNHRDGILNKALPQMPNPTLRPQSPIGGQPNLAQLRQLLTQLHAQQMVNRMTKHAAYHGR